MIRGVVNDRREAVLRLQLRGPAGAELDVNAIVDTGFSSSLTLPSTVIASLGLVRESSTSAKLGDGSIRRFDIYAAEVEWGGTWRTVLVSAIGNETLLGMRLIAGHKLVIDVVPGGSVEVVPLS